MREPPYPQEAPSISVQLSSSLVEPCVCASGHKHARAHKHCQSTGFSYTLPKLPGSLSKLMVITAYNDVFWFDVTTHADKQPLKKKAIILQHGMHYKAHSCDFYITWSLLDRLYSWTQECLKAGHAKFTHCPHSFSGQNVCVCEGMPPLLPVPISRVGPS